MRPAFLSVEGLACFKEKQEIDFAQLDLFAISGPTGAGKSTLLDAILFALYGAVPRVGKHDLKEMISASRDRVTVRFDFHVGDHRFRITRALRRKGAAAVRLEKHDGQDFNENVADQVRATEDAIKRIIGLDGDAFTQAVVLPQGKFARFLQADPRDRRSMLRTLLRLEVYERMRDEAQRVSNTKKTTRDSVQKLLANEYDGVTEEALTGLATKAKQVDEKLEGLRNDRDAAQEQLNKIRALHAKTEELARNEQRFAKLNDATTEIEAIRSELDAAQRAMALIPVLEAATRAAEQAKRARADADQAKLAHEDAVKVHRENDERLQIANTAAAEIIPLREKVATLNQVLGRLPERDRLTKVIKRQRTDVGTMKEKLDGLRISVDELSKKQLEQTGAVSQARAGLEDITYNADLHAALEEVRDHATRLSVTREGLKKAKEEKTRRQKTLVELTSRIELLQSEVRSARHVEVEAQKAVDLADRAVHGAHRMDEANHLRQSLTAGEPCPVCEQVVHDPPLANLHPDVEKAKSEREQATLILEDAQKKVREKHQVMAREEANAETAQRAKDEAEIAYNNAVHLGSQQQENIRTLLSGRGPTDEQVIEVWVIEQVQSSSAARKAHDEAKQRLEQTERELAKTQESQRATKERIEETDKALARLDEELKENERQLDELEKEIAKFTVAPDPEAERDGLVERIEYLELQQKTAADRAAGTKNQLTASEQVLVLKAKVADEDEIEAAERQRARDERLDQAGFEDPRAVEVAVRDADVQKRLRERVQTHERERHAVEERINVLVQELGTDRVSKDQLDGANKRASELTKEVEKLVGQGQKLQQQIESMRKRIERSKELRGQLKTEERAYRLYSHLASDLRSDKFQAYVLEETFTELVCGASARLLAFTRGRYSLEFAEDQIVVVDHDNAGETRISDTLSGGETFLTSLSLALELSDQVQRAAGAVNLDSLFIDEGFGTLDPDTLAVVSETIQSLQIGGRMVGIITHIPELRDEFSQQILVTKHQGYSTVEVRTRAT